MQIVMDNTTGLDLEPYMDVAERVIIESLAFEGVRFEAEVSLLFVLDEQIRELNRDYRKIDAVTDVLSFPLLSGDESKALNESYNGDETETAIGDIVIAFGRAQEQAAQYGHSLAREIGFLTAHSVLHLLGYDHMTGDEEAEMQRRQEEILLRVGLTRDCGDCGSSPQ